MTDAIDQEDKWKCLLLNKGIDIIPSVVPRRSVGVSPEGRLEEILARQSETGGGQGWRDP